MGTTEVNAAVPAEVYIGKGCMANYLHAWRKNFVDVQCWVSTDKAAHLPDNSICVLDKLIEVNEHHAARKQTLRLKLLTAAIAMGASSACKAAVLGNQWVQVHKEKSRRCCSM